MTVEKLVTPVKSQPIKFDAIGIEQLETLLRERISEYLQSRTTINGRVRKGSYELLSIATGISTSYLQQFNKNERTIAVICLNKLACHFNIRYAIVNFPPE